ncbi:hypothetical protein SNE40_014120 [Patella caerulea]|uniref:C2H2-type domain-containing protein n=1 Tax=Patella caerulea TaxID=87958 RepID=A0AAN8JDB3_PATCE
MDWAMKFLPTRFREAQQDWFGKKGISWHVSAAVVKEGDELRIYAFVHLVEKCSQNWQSVFCIAEETVRKVKEVVPGVNRVFFRSDNAGCYHSASLVLAMPSLSRRQGVQVARYDFSEAQAGKDLCDRKIASLKSHIEVYINEGHDVTTAAQMLEACKSYGGVRGCYVAVVARDDSGTEKAKWDGITSFTNFSYEREGVTVWKGYGIGNGPVHKLEKLLGKVDANFETDYTVSTYSTPRVKTGLVRSSRSKESATQFLCTQEGCIKVFKTEKALDRHLSVGRHERVPVMDSKDDSIMRKWGRQVASRTALHESAAPSTSHGGGSSSSSAPIEGVNSGWAARTTAKRRQFSNEIKKYLLEQFMIDVETGRKEDPRGVTKRIKSLYEGRLAKCSTSSFILLQIVRSAKMWSSVFQYDCCDRG